MEDFSSKMRDQARQFGESMRQQAREHARQRKAEYLGARVPPSLKAKVIAHAEALSIPVSDLIRETLEKAFSELPDVTPASKPASDNRFPGIIGWELIELNQAMPCSCCQTPLGSGERVSLGLALAGGEHAILCRRCRPQASS